MHLEVFRVCGKLMQRCHRIKQRILKRRQGFILYIVFKISEEHSWVCPEDSFK